MKILAVNASPRKHGNTATLLSAVFDEPAKRAWRDATFSGTIVEAAQMGKRL